MDYPPLVPLHTCRALTSPRPSPILIALQIGEGDVTGKITVKNALWGEVGLPNNRNRTSYLPFTSFWVGLCSVGVYVQIFYQVRINPDW